MSGRAGNPRKKSRLIVLAAVAAVLAVVVSIALASRSGETRTTGSDCPVQALRCSPGQFDPADSRSPSPSASRRATGPTVDAGGDAKAPGIDRPTPTPSRTRHTTSPPRTGAPRPGGPCAAPAACGFPDASVTGPRLALSAHKTGDMTIRSDNQVIRGWDLTGSLDIYANNVTVIDSRIASTNWWGVNLRPGFHGLRVLHNEIIGVPGKGQDNGGEDYAVSNMGGSSIEVGWNDVSAFGNALSMGQGTIHDNYVHDFVPFINQGGEYQHTDAVISDGGGTGELIIRHNTLLNATPIDKGASASVGLYADTAPVTHTTVDGNWLAGGAYALYGGGDGANHIQVTDNVFSTQYHPKCGAYGPIAAWNAAGEGNVWSGNRMSDGTPVLPEPAA
ncbi:hypothetical protein [Streptomyces sp. NBC_01190]|uniref:hypothetical protein n=1 Tax=Streptomyces sp. NBC_01190 TaxID=2903767 RepID=UPI003868AC5B|nr:hypothetical protein OG519_03330 [Streptomyces sp. NBC_01190]